jgi:hypothetical protein
MYREAITLSHKEAAEVLCLSSSIFCGKGRRVVAAGFRRSHHAARGFEVGHGPAGRVQEAFPDSRQDMYRIDGSVCLALDRYCINPSCTCREARVEINSSVDGQR